MAIKKSDTSRRAFLRGTVPAIAGGWAALRFPNEARAQRPGATPGAADIALVDERRIWSNEYWAQKGNVRLNMFRKRAGAPQPGQAALPVLFLVHGSSISSRSSYDLKFPGHGEYSMMNKFADWGYDVWTMDHEGYGRSSRGEGNSDIKSGVEDLRAAVEVVARETGQQRYHMFGESSGALRVGAYAMVQPLRVNRLVFSATTYTGEGSPTLATRAQQLPFFRANNRRPRDRAMIDSIFTRDKAGTSEPGIGAAIAAMELPLGDTVPTGTYLDMTANMPINDPEKILAPVLMLRGEYDGNSTEIDLINMYRKFPNNDKQYVTVPGAAHSLVYATNRHQVWHIIKAFLELPPRLDALKPA
jgi:alpha-beta hydrolase superfamily lysophospholipase